MSPCAAGTRSLSHRCDDPQVWPVRLGLKDHRLPLSGQILQAVGVEQRLMEVAALSAASVEPPAQLVNFVGAIALEEPRGVCRSEGDVDLERSTSAGVLEDPIAGDTRRDPIHRVAPQSEGPVSLHSWHFHITGDLTATTEADARRQLRAIARLLQDEGLVTKIVGTAHPPIDRGPHELS